MDQDKSTLNISNNIEALSKLVLFPDDPVECVEITEKAILTMSDDEFQELWFCNPDIPTLTPRTLALAMTYKNPETVKMLLKDWWKFIPNRYRRDEDIFPQKVRLDKWNQTRISWYMMPILGTPFCRPLFGDLEGVDMDLLKKAKPASLEDRVKNLRLLFQTAGIHDAGLLNLWNKSARWCYLLAYLTGQEEFIPVLDLEAYARYPLNRTIREFQGSQNYLDVWQFLMAMETVSPQIKEEPMLCYLQEVRKFNEQLTITNLMVLAYADCPKVILELFKNHKPVNGMSRYTAAKLMIDEKRPQDLAGLLDAGLINVKTSRERLIEYATKEKNTECLAILLDYKNRTSDPIKEAEAQERKEMQELMAKPDSVYMLKKSWTYKKQEDGTLIINAYKGSDTNVVVPSKIGKGIVTAIGKGAFSSYYGRPESRAACHTIESITLPDTLKSIGNEAFYGLRLESLDIPASVDHLSEQAFYGLTTARLIFRGKHTSFDYYYAPLSNFLYIKTIIVPRYSNLDKDLSVMRRHRVRYLENYPELMQKEKT